MRFLENRGHNKLQMVDFQAICMGIVPKWTKRHKMVNLIILLNSKEKQPQWTLSISNLQGTTKFVRDRESSREREKNRLQSTQRDRDFSSR